MAKFQRVAPDPSEVINTPQSLGEAETEWGDALLAMENLRVERVSKRESLGRTAWREYNHSTSNRQIEVSDRLAAAEKTLSRFKGTTDGQRVQIGVASEKNKAGKG